MNRKRKRRPNTVKVGHYKTKGSSSDWIMGALFAPKRKRRKSIWDL